MATSACCIRNAQRARFSSQNDIFRSHSHREATHYDSRPRLQRKIHATPIRRTFAVPRKTRDPLTSTATGVGQSDALVRGWTSFAEICHRSSKYAGARRDFTSVGLASSAVTDEAGQQVPTLELESDLSTQSGSSALTRIEKDEYTALGYMQREGHLVIRNEFLSGDPKDTVLCRKFCYIQNTKEKIEIQANASTKRKAERKACLLLVANLKKSSSWERIVLADAKSKSVLHDGNELHYRRFHELWNQKYFQLDIAMTKSTSDGHTCRVFCTIPDRKKPVQAAVWASSQYHLQTKTFLLLISKLQQIGAWQEWNDGSDAVDVLRNILPADSVDSSNLPFRQISNMYRKPLRKATETLLQASSDLRCALDIDHTNSNVDRLGCAITFSARGSKERIDIITWGKSSESAKRKAFRFLFSRLHETRDLDRVVDHAQLTIDDELLEVIDHNRNVLLQAKILAQKECFNNSQQAPHSTPSPKVNAARETKRSEQLWQALSRINESQDPRALALQSARAQLRVNELKQPILDLINQNAYSVIVAETGSGKSTQIPQILLDDAIQRNEGSSCKVLCVQPRRIAAQMLARRVAEERFETVGQTVGCIVRLDHRASIQGGTITYCTTGILLKMLQNASNLLESYTHIMLDEVHERNIDIDFAMLILKRHIDQLQSKGSSAPRIIVSSATVDVDLFSSYFRNKGLDGSLIRAPHISIPGRQYPVRNHYLDEILEDLMSSFSPDTLASFLRGKETARFLQEHYAQFDVKSTEGEDQTGSGDEETGSSSSPIQVTRDDADPLIPFGLICAQIFHLLRTTEHGSILVFVPGLRDILSVEQQLQEFADIAGFDLTNEDRFRILKLHAQLPEELEKLPLKVPSGCRRILLSTDVAEASVTLPDLKYVVDTGRVNQANFESSSFSSQILPHWASRSSVTQRAGRAGRVQEGEYFFLGTKQRFDTLRITKSPEMLRTNLQSSSLRAKHIAPEIPLSEFFSLAIEPPDEEKVQATINALRNMGALRVADKNEVLTQLGSTLVHFPVDPIFGKLIVLGVIFRCLDPLLILAMLGDSEIFYRAVDEDEIRRIHANRIIFAENSRSDHIAAVNAFKAVQDVWTKQGRQKANDFAFSHSVYFSIYRDTFAMVSQLFEHLKHRGLVHSLTPLMDDEGQFGGAELNTNSKNTQLIKALLLHCLSPRLAAPKFATTFPSLLTKTEPSGFIHHLSPNRYAPNQQSLVMYNKKLLVHKTDAMLLDATLITPLMACIFGTELAKGTHSMIVDSWLRVGVDLQHTTRTYDEVASSLTGLSDTLGEAFETAFETFGSSLDDLSYSQRQRFVNARRALFDTLQSSVRDVLMRDQHRVEYSDEALLDQLESDWPSHQYGGVHA